MKKWEKPMLQNLSLNQTQEEGIEPVALIPKYRCCSCRTTYDKFGGSIILGVGWRIENFDQSQDKWKCGNKFKCENKGPIVAYKGGLCS